ncbi:MAG: Ig-like domain-containing protein, partial [Anaerolineae bacterium]
PTPYTDIAALAPQAGDTFAKGAFIPARIDLTGQARVAGGSAAVDGAARPFSFDAGANGHSYLQLPDNADTAQVGFTVNGGSVADHQISLVDNDAGIETVRVIQPASNQGFTEGDTLTVEYAITHAGAEPFDYAGIALLDFNQNVIARILSDAPGGRVALRLPAVDAWENYYVRVRGYFGAAYDYAQQQTGIRLFPQNQLPALAIAGVGDRIIQGSDLECYIETTLTADMQTALAVYDDNDTLLASGDTRVGLAVPATTSYLRIKADLSDQLGNNRSVERTVQVIDPFVPNTGVQTLGFQAALPDVGRAWFARGRALYDGNDQQLAQLDAPITALDHLGDRLILALSDVGIVVVDPADGYRVLSNHPVTGAITRIRVADNRLLTLVDGILQGYSISGNAVDEMTVVGVNGPVRDIQARGSGFVVLTQSEMVRLDGDFTITQRIEGAFTALAQCGRYLFAADAGGRLHVLSADLDQDRTYDLGLTADRLLPLQGDLAALNRNGRMQIVDIRDPLQPVLIGAFTIDHQGSVDQSIIAGGRLFIGGDSGPVITLQRGGGIAATELYKTEKARGNSIGLAATEGRFIAAAEHYGAILLSRQGDGQWREQVYPSAYTVATRAVAARDGIFYLMQSDMNRVISLRPDNGAFTEQVVLSGTHFDHLLVTDDRIVAAAGDTLYIARIDDPGINDTVQVSAGDPIEALAAAGDSLLVATAGGTVFRVDTGPFPIDHPRIRINTVTSAAEPIRLMASDNDYLYFALGAVAHRLRLSDLDDQYLDLGQTIDALALSPGRLWIGQGNEITGLDTHQWTAAAVAHLTMDHGVTDLVCENDQLAVATGAFGLALYQLPLGQIGASGALRLPTENTVYQQNQTITLKPWRTAGINAVRYAVNGEQRAVRTSAPFEANFPVPAELRNGQPFEITTRIETVWGQVFTSAVRRVMLQGQGLPANPFSVDLQLDGQFLPRPLEMRAFIHNSTQAVAQVEFYYGADAAGPFQLIGKHYGPEYVIYRNFGAESSGHYIKVRAVDVYGNTAETGPLPFLRLSDPFRPTAVFSLEGSVIGSSPVAGHPFTVKAELSDGSGGSGVELALLRRNGLIVAAAFADGPLRYTEAAPAAGQTYDYSIYVRDRAQNERTVVQSYTALADAPPTVSQVTAPSAIREQESFNVQVQAVDDLQIDHVDVLWHGRTATHTVAPPSGAVDAVLAVTDARNPLQQSIDELLTVTVTDSLGQQTAATQTITVAPNTAPDAGALAISVPASGFFGKYIPLTITGLEGADDGPISELTVTLIDVTAGGEQQIRRLTPMNDRLQISLFMPRDDQNGADFRFFVRLTDNLGRTADSSVQTVHLTRVPNVIRFDALGTAGVNPDVSEVGQDALLQVLVLDSAAQPVPNQTIAFKIIGGPADVGASLGTALTDAAGSALLTFDSHRPAGDYRIQATVQAFGAISAVHNLELLSGGIDHIDIAHLAPVPAGEFTTLHISARDAGGNIVTDANLELLSIAIPHAG